jgi:Gas vesicle synthesis protein GvpL/GvpF
MPQTATYVYCVVQRATRPSVARSLRGLPGSARPSLVELGRMRWAVVGLVPLDRYGDAAIEASIRDLDWVSSVALAHEAVVEYFARGRDSTVVPMKLFTMFSSAERLVGELHSRQAGITAAIGRIRGAREWSVRVMHRQPATRTTSRSRAIQSGAAFLAAKKQVREDARQEIERARAAADRTFGMLARISKETRRRDDVPDGAVAPPLLDAAFLVAAAKTTQFRAAVRRASADCRRAGAALTLTGPWPAYNFVGPAGAQR